MTAGALKLAPGLTLPRSAVTDTWAWFGTRGTGKTYGAGATVEAMVAAGDQVVIVDPVGVWYGLRLAKDGRGRGLDIPVFGGLHADVPLEATGGDLVARLVVENHLGAVLDVSMMTLAQQHRFVLAFATALFNLKKSNRAPVFVLFDEAHEFIPQQPGPAEAEMLSAVRRLWKMGRNFGIGVGLISPRPAEVNKGVVNLTERMFCGRLKGPHDRRAMTDWATSQEVDDKALDQLSRLPSGELMYWSDRGPERVRFFPKKTFDASKTPEAGDAQPLDALPKIDLAAVREAMAATIEEAKANDPRALKTRIAELERKIAAPAPPQPPEVREMIVYRLPDRLPPIVSDVEAKLAHVEGELVAISSDLRAARGAVASMQTIVAEAQAAIDAARSPARVDLRARRALPSAPRPETIPLLGRASRAKVGDENWHNRAPDVAGDDKPTAGDRAALTVLANFPDGVTLKKLAILARYAPGGSTMRGILAHLRKRAWITEAGDVATATPAGLQVLGHFERMPADRAALRQFWINDLPACAGAFLDALVRVYPRGLAPEGLAAATGDRYAAGGSTMRGGLARLRALDLVRDDSGQVVASADLFA